MTPLCARLDIDHPIIQAPVGSASTPELVAAVSDAGGLGMLSATWRQPEEMRALLRRIRALTDRPFGVNLVLEWDQRERLALCLDEGVSHVSLFWGDPAPYAPAIQAAGATLWHSVGSAAEARRAVDAGADVIVAQGWEAGGHVWGTVTTLALVPAVVDAVGPIPVVAAGGIADGRGIAAALCLGAQAAWIGTRFLLTDEAAIHPHYRARLAEAVETDTAYTCLFDGGWERAPHRVLENETLARWRAVGEPPPGYRPGEGQAMALDPDGDPVLRYSSNLPRPGGVGDVGAQALYCGQGVALARETLPAGELVRLLADQTQMALAGATAVLSRTSSSGARSR